MSNIAFVSLRFISNFFTSLLILSVSLSQVNCLQHEFLRSFILRPWMLSNATLAEPSVQMGPVTLSLYVDNWSQHTLVLDSDRLNDGVWETNLEPRNMGSKRRDLLFRTVSSDGGQARTSGVVGWTLTDGLNPLSRFTIAWDVGNGIKASKFAAALGSFIPTGEEMWQPAPKMISKGLSSLQTSSQLDDTVYLIQPKIALAAVNMTMRDGEGLHFRLSVSIVPPNIDVWGWIKYYRETVNTVGKNYSTNNLTNENKVQSFFSNETNSTGILASKSGIKLEVKMIPEMKEIKPKMVEAKMVEVTIPESSPTLSAATMVTPTTTTTSTSNTTLSKTTNIFHQHRSLTDEDIPLHHQKHLLKKGPSYKYLDDHNATLRGSLAKLDETIAVGIHIENWSRFTLSLSSMELVSGKITSQGEEKFAPPPPGTVAPGTYDYGVIVQAAPLSGTNGVARWSISGMDRVLSIMWSIPYNRQLWRTWISVGLTSHGLDLPTYDELYSGQHSNGRFARRKAGHQFEYSDGQFIIVAQMDGDATFKPVLQIVLAPIPSVWLASTVRTQLGMKVTPETSLSLDQTWKNTQKRQDTPTVSHVVGTSSSSSFCQFHISILIFFEIPVFLWL